jgi:hypothetical protein
MHVNSIGRQAVTGSDSQLWFIDTNMGGKKYCIAFIPEGKLVSNLVSHPTHSTRSSWFTKWWHDGGDDLGMASLPWETGT